MPIGKLARKVLGSHFRPVGEAYRAFFVDMNKVADCMALHISPGSHVLDIGGGDGYVVNLLLKRFSDLRVTMTDLLPTIGTFIDDENLDRVTFCPATDFRYVHGAFDVVTIADVVHHIPKSQRQAFFTDLAQLCRDKTLIIKDIEPGGPIALASLISDLYVTGDKSVSLVSSAEIKSYIEAAFEPSCIEVTMPDKPNYMIVVRPRTVS